MVEIIKFKVKINKRKKINMAFGKLKKKKKKKVD